MNSLDIGILLGCLALLTIALIVCLHSIQAISNRNLETLSNLAQRSEAERDRIRSEWSEERKDLLNRLMTKEWQSYAQLTSRSQFEGETLVPQETDRGTGEVLVDYE